MAIKKYWEKIIVIRIKKACWDFEIMARIDPDEIIEEMQSLNELKDQFYDRFRLGMIMKKDYDYIFKRLDEITDYLINQSGYEE